jgi:hypothetical protein
VKPLTSEEICDECEQPMPMSDYYAVEWRELRSLFGLGRYEDLPLPVRLYGVLAERARAASVARADCTSASTKADDDLDELARLIRRDARPLSPEEREEILSTLRPEALAQLNKLERRAGPGGKVPK